jgi:hypothetical protein
MLFQPLLRLPELSTTALLSFDDAYMGYVFTVLLCPGHCLIGLLALAIRPTKAQLGFGLGLARVRTLI